MLSQTAEYALRATVQLALAEEPMTNRHLADITRVPAGYLAKVMKQLVDAGLVSSRRGKKGGFLLADPINTTVFDVVQAVDPIRPYERCPLEAPYDCHEICPLHRQLNAAIEHVLISLKSASIRDLAQRRRVHRLEGGKGP